MAYAQTRPFVTLESLDEVPVALTNTFLIDHRSSHQTGWFSTIPALQAPG